MILCTETIFLSVFLDFWTWASLNFGELNLYLPPPLKIHARKRERMWLIMAEEVTFLFQDVISMMIFASHVIIFLMCFVSQGCV